VLEREVISRACTWCTWRMRWQWRSRGDTRALSDPKPQTLKWATSVAGVGNRKPEAVAFFVFVHPGKKVYELLNLWVWSCWGFHTIIIISTFVCVCRHCMGFVFGKREEILVRMSASYIFLSPRADSSGKNCMRINAAVWNGLKRSLNFGQDKNSCINILSLRNRKKRILKIS